MHFQYWKNENKQQQKYNAAVLGSNPAKASIPSWQLKLAAEVSSIKSWQLKLAAQVSSNCSSSYALFLS
jgi:hypothetical protein